MMNTFLVPNTLRLQKLNGRPQLIILSTDALKAVLELPPRYWSANSAPIEGLSSNKTFLTYLDNDNNNRIMPTDVVSAVQWLIETLTDLNGCILGTSSIPLSNFREDTQTGKQLKETATLVLNNLHKTTPHEIQLQDVQERAKIVQFGATNGDGVLPPSFLEDVEQSFVQDCLQIFEGQRDISGELGINTELLLNFNTKVAAWLLWLNQCPHKIFTEDMLNTIDTIQHVLDEHFIWTKHPNSDLKKPLLTNTPTTTLCFNDWVHPSLRVHWKNLWTQVLGPLSIQELTVQSWEQVWWIAEEYRNWLRVRPNGNFTNVPLDRLQEMCLQDDIQSSLHQKLAKDKAVSNQLLQLSNLEKTLLFQQDLCFFLNSFVNFSNFYNPKFRSVPEIGSLLLDGRWFRLVVQVPNKSKHIQQAQHSGFFLLYLTVTLTSGTMDIAVAVTGSNRGDIHIGKKGVFYDIDFVQCPAEITDIIDNPININEALLKPIEKLQLLITQRLERFSKEQERKLESGFNTETPSEKAHWVNSGVTLAALSSSFAYLLKTLSSVKISSIFLVIFAPLTLLAIFSSLVAGWRLHRRDLGPILEASGWGINHPLRVPDWASEVFTHRADVPKQNQSTETDLLRVFEHTANPLGKITRIVMWVTLLLLICTVWWQWDNILIFIQNWEPPITS